jgi:hypothetical protein
MRWSFDTDNGEVTVEGRYAFRLLGRCLWHIPPEGEEPALYCRAYDERSGQEQAYIGFVDVTDDPDEPWVSAIKTDTDAEAFDDRLRADAERLLSADGRPLVRWMGTRIQTNVGIHSLLTAYIATDGPPGDRQYADLRFEDAGRKLILATCFNVARADELAAPVLSTFATLKMGGGNPA